MSENKHHALAREAILAALTAYTGITTADGNIGGTTLQDRNLIGSNDFISNKTILIGSGDAALEDSGAVSFAPLTGIITVSTLFSAQIKAGTVYRILNIPADTDPKVMGRAQIAATTIELQQAENTYVLFTGTTEAVILESLNIKMPTGAPEGALTSISIQTDDATPGVIISAVDGAVANLLTEADLGWTGSLYITVDTTIGLTIAGGAAGASYVCQVTAKCRAVVSGGHLA